MMAATPSARAEQERITDAQRACVQRALNNPAADDANAALKCLSSAKAGKAPASKKELAPDSPEAEALFATLQARMSSKPKPYQRPEGVTFADVKKALKARPDLLSSLFLMEETGGEPDVIAVEDGTFVFADVSEESPKGRRNLTFDEAKAMAAKMGVKMMDDKTYLGLNLGETGRGTWSWVLPNAKIRAPCNTLYDSCGDDNVRAWQGVKDYRYPNGGWRGLLRVPKF